MKSLEELIHALPPELQREVQDFAQFLLDTRVPQHSRKLQLGWAGGLRELREQYTSLELQEKAQEWWGS